MSHLRAAGVVKTDASAYRERLALRRFARLLRPLFLLLLLAPRLRGSSRPALPRAPRLRQPDDCSARRPGAPPPDPAARLDAIAEWIGAPSGRGRIVPEAPAAGARQEVRIWEASGELATRAIRIGRVLGAGLAGTVYEVEDDEGNRFVEKHYGKVPAPGMGLGRKLTAMVFSLFRQAPLSFRELPESVVAIHLANRFIVAASIERFGCSITPPLLYTRYDARTGGYAQAFALVEGRPLRPTEPGLPLLGEAAVFLPLMRRWRDFLANELGFWGLARQIDPANVNSYGNLWITPDRHVVLLDLVPGVPGFLEPRYIWWGLSRGQFAPFADAVDLERLARWLDCHRPRTLDWPREDLALLRLALERWQDAEPRLVSSPLRPVRVLTDPRVRAGTRAALLTHLEVKGAVTAEQAREYRETLAATGRFPKLVRHSMLKMAPLTLHLALIDRGHAWRFASRVPRLPLKLTRVLAAGAARLARAGAGLFLALARHVASRELRMRTFRTRVGGWIESERQLGRLTGHQAEMLRRDVDEDQETADLAGLFVVHLSVSAVKHALFGPSAVWLGLALATETWWLALPAMIAPLLRVATAVWMGFARRPGLLVLCALPDVGVLAAPLYLSRIRPDLGGFIVRVLAQKGALAVPAFGQRGGLLEMAAVAAAQVLVIGPARVLPAAFLVGLFAVLQESWWAALAAVSLYAAGVLYAMVRGPHSRERSDPEEAWQIGMPARISVPAGGGGHTACARGTAATSSRSLQ